MRGDGKKIAFFFWGKMGGAPAQLYDQARDGVVDVVWSLAGYTPGRFPRSEAFELPFFTYDAEGSSRAAWDYIANYAPDEFREVKLLACHTHGLNILHMKSKLVTKASDMRGLKVRGGAGLAEVAGFVELGALGGEGRGLFGDKRVRAARHEHRHQRGGEVEAAATF